MHRHHELSRTAHFLLRHIERYRRSPLGRQGACRFTPTCSYYAEEALRARAFPVAIALVAWRLLRCNPFMHQRVADPIRRSRRRRLRPNTLPTLFSILALSGFVVVVTAGVAEAVGVNNGCSATLNGRDPAQLDSDHPLLVHKHEAVSFTGKIPPSVPNPAQDVNNTHIDVAIIGGIASVSSSDHPGHGPTWGGTQNVDNYLKYGVGLYHVTGHASGTGGWSCDGDAYVQLKDGNPLGKPIGAVALAFALFGVVGAGLSTRGGDPGEASYGFGGDDSGREWERRQQREHEEEIARDREARAEKQREDAQNPFSGLTTDAQVQRGKLDRSSDAYASMGCLIALLAVTGAAVTGKNLGAGVVAAAATGRSGPRRVWAHGHPIAGFISGLLLGIGVAVLLQQFAVWPLTIVTAIIFPVATAIVCSLRAWLGKPYSYA